MSNVNQELISAIASLLLPISESSLESAAQNVQNLLIKKGIAEVDHLATLKREWRAWTLDGEETKLLKTLVNAALSGEPLLPKSFVSKYFATFKVLIGSRYLPPHQARSLLGNSLLIFDLLQKKKMSCTQIARVLSVTQSGHQFNWEMIQPIANSLGVLPKLKPEFCDAVFESDILLEETRFVDATPIQAIDIISDVGDALGYEGSLFEDLQEFYSDYKPGYGIMLHMSCLVLEFYDHPPQEAPYEFNPRGVIATDLAKRFHKGYSASESPYLNNAKGASNLDISWAWARQPKFIRSALSFATLLERLGNMPYTSRRQLAPWIRQWLHRIAREQANQYSPLESATRLQVENFLNAAVEGNTETRGVLDQRVVDLLSCLHHSDWTSRGLGDFVNASNLRKKKTGDVEFMNMASGQIVSYEAHGGKLSQVYVDIHRQTLRQVLRRRMDELTSGRNPEDWDISIIFIAHDLGNTKNFTEIIEGFNIRWKFRTYDSLLSETRDKFSMDFIIEEFDTRMTNQINRVCVAESVREKFRHMSKSSCDVE